MNRRDFGKAAMAVAATAVIAPRALAATPQTIVDCVVIDYARNAVRWVNLKNENSEGRKFVYEPAGGIIEYRHFEFLRSDGLVMGGSARKDSWTAGYDALENEFLHMSKLPAVKQFDLSEFKSYVENVRYYFNGRIVPIDQLA